MVHARALSERYANAHRHSAFRRGEPLGAGRMTTDVSEEAITGGWTPGTLTNDRQTSPTSRCRSLPTLFVACGVLSLDGVSFAL